MQIQAIDNRTNFQQKLILDGKTIAKATREEKAQLVAIKNMFKNKKPNGDIKISLNKAYSFKVSETLPKNSYIVQNESKTKITVKDIIEHLQNKLSSK